MAKIYTEIVSIELAKKLREITGPIIVEHYYYESSNVIPAPTYAEVLDWLIGKGINIYFAWEHRDITKCSVIINFEGETKDCYKTSFSSPLEALEWGITNALELV